MQINFAGAVRSLVDYRDFDFIKTFFPHIYAGNLSATPTFPTEYLTDVGGNIPNQNIDDPAFTPPVKAMPYGCTSETAARIATNLTLGKQILRPDTIDAITNANALRGFDARQALIIALNKLGWFTGVFNIRAYYPLDFFDAFRLAQFSGAPELRSISLTTPWFPSWENAILGQIVTKELDGSYSTMGGGAKAVLLPPPTNDELAALRANINAFPWHNHLLDGWTQKVNGILTYRDLSWQGPDIGEGGAVHFDRATINMVMSLRGTIAFTATRMGIGAPQTIDVTVVQYIVSFMRNLLGYQY